MADIFLSYAHEERERVRPLVTAFEAQGWSVWWDQQLETGESWDEEIEKELANARVVVTVFSAQSVESRFVRAESMEAYDNDKLFPVRLDDIKVPLAFRTVQVADLIGWSPRQIAHVRRAADESLPTTYLHLPAQRGGRTR